MNIDILTADEYKNLGIDNKAILTDYALLNGGFYRKDFADKYGFYWTKSINVFKEEKNKLFDWKHGLNTKITNIDGDVNVIFYDGSTSIMPSFFRSGSARIVIKDINLDSNIKEVTCGYYPQDAADEFMQKMLEYYFKHGYLNKSGNVYLYAKDTLNDGKNNNYALNEEYEVDGKRYVRVKNNNYHFESLKLSNNERYNKKEYVWVEVKPVSFYYIHDKKMLVSKKLLFSGICYNVKKDYIYGFEKTDLYNYLNIYLINELLQEYKNNILKQDEDIVKLVRK